jgi:tetratricopeptide (TPR) repeat protein
VAEKYVLQNHTPMTVPTVDPPADGNHRNPMQQFKAYLRRNLLYTVRLVQATEQLLTDEVRTQALHTLSYALGERELWPLVRALLLALAPKMELGGHREDWLPYLQQGLAQSKVLGDFATAAECQLQRGLIARLLSDFAGAREQLTASVALATQAGEPRTQARALNELAWLEQLQEAYAAAEGHVAQALTLLDEDDPERAMCYRVLGMIAFGQQKWLEAETYHRRALEIFEQHHDQRRIAWSLQNLAYTLQGQQQYGEAILLFQRAAEMLSEIGDNYHLGIVLLNLGVIYALSERYNEAIDNLSQAGTLLHKLHSR